MYKSMFKTENGPNRLEACINALKELIKIRFEEDSSSSFAIVKFSDKAKKVLDFSNITEHLYSALDSLTFGGHSMLVEALALSIKLIIAELRKIAAKIPRILLISDGNYSKNDVDPIKIGRLAQGLNIKIDTFRIGDASNLNILKRLSDISGGRYYYYNDIESFFKSARDFALANVKTFGSSSKSSIENPIFLRKIAADLLRVQDLTEDQEQRLMQLRGEADYKKCSICFSNKDPKTGGSFYLTGRYCPNCQTPFHIHCLAAWASSQKDTSLKSSGTCRCPHCFYLLKIPSEVTQLHKFRTLTGSRAQKKIGSETPEMFTASVMNINDLGEDALYNSCPVCNYIFEEGQKVVQCGNPECGTLYHIECVQKLNNGVCKKCDMKLNL